MTDEQLARDEIEGNTLKDYFANFLSEELDNLKKNRGTDEYKHALESFINYPDAYHLMKRHLLKEQKTDKNNVALYIEPAIHELNSTYCHNLKEKPANLGKALGWLMAILHYGFLHVTRDKLVTRERNVLDEPMKQYLATAKMIVEACKHFGLSIPKSIIPEHLSHLVKIHGNLTQQYREFLAEIAVIFHDMTAED